MTMHLTALKPGERAEVVKLEAEGYSRRRLMDLGVTPGVTIEVVIRSALREPLAYRVRDTLLALRREQAKQILVKKLNP